MTLPLPQFLTIKEAAEVVRVSPNTFAMWLSKGKLPRVKAGGRTLVRREALEAFLTETTGKVWE